MFVKPTAVPSALLYVKREKSPIFCDKAKVQDKGKTGYIFL